MPVDPDLTRRRFLLAALATALAACADRIDPTPRPLRSAGPTVAEPSPSPTASPRAGSPVPRVLNPARRPRPRRAPTATPTGPTTRRLYRDGALADGSSDRLRLGVSILVEDGVISWIRPSDGEEDPGPRRGLEVIDASGATFVPGMVDAHSHLTMPGGAHWIDRGLDSPAAAIRVAERNGRLLTSAGVRWARDVGAPQGVDPEDGRERALSLGVRDRWAASGQRSLPHIRAAGTWLTRTGSLPADLTVEVRDADAAPRRSRTPARRRRGPRQALPRRPRRGNRAMVGRRGASRRPHGARP